MLPRNAPHAYDKTCLFSLQEYFFHVDPLGEDIQKSDRRGRFTVQFLEQMKIQDFTNQVIVFLAAAKQIKAVPTTKAVFFKAAITDLLS